MTHSVPGGPRDTALNAQLGFDTVTTAEPEDPSCEATSHPRGCPDLLSA